MNHNITYENFVYKYIPQIQALFYILVSFLFLVSPSILWPVHVRPSSMVEARIIWGRWRKWDPIILPEPIFKETRPTSKLGQFENLDSRPNDYGPTSTYLFSFVL